MVGGSIVAFLNKKNLPPSGPRQGAYMPFVAKRGMRAHGCLKGWSPIGRGVPKVYASESAKLFGSGKYRLSDISAMYQPTAGFHARLFRRKNHGVNY